VTISAFFTSYGNRSDPSPRVLVWEQMLYQAMRLLDEAQRRVCSADSQKELRKLDGWWRSKKVKIGQTECLVPSEEAISEALWAEMEKIKEEMTLKIGPLDPSMSGVDLLHVFTETPRTVRKGIGRKSKPTDIRFYRTGSEVLDLRIEAKVVLKESDLKPYLSKDGLKRFSDEDEPYTTHEIGGMVAYALTSDKSTWIDRIDGALQNEKPPLDTFRQRVKTISDETLFSRVPCKLASTTRDQVLVFHVVLEFECEPTARA
jgi:hypothetical protein